jgi:hypothetical protein
VYSSYIRSQLNIASKRIEKQQDGEKTSRKEEISKASLNRLYQCSGDYSNTMEGRG